MGNREDVRRRGALAGHPSIHPEVRWFIGQINTYCKGRALTGLPTTTTTTTTSSTTSSTTTTAP